MKFCNRNFKFKYYLFIFLKLRVDLFLSFKSLVCATFIQKCLDRILTRQKYKYLEEKKHKIEIFIKDWMLQRLFLIHVIIYDHIFTR